MVRRIAPPRKPELLTSKEAARILDISPDDMYKLVEYGEVIGGKRDNSRIRWYTKSSVLAYKERRDKNRGVDDAR